MISKIFSLLLIMGLTQLTACGQKGDLFLPEDPQALSEEAQALNQAQEQASEELNKEEAALVEKVEVEEVPVEEVDLEKANTSD